MKYRDISTNYFLSLFFINSFEIAIQKTLVYLSYCSSIILFLSIFMVSPDLYSVKQTFFNYFQGQL